MQTSQHARTRPLACSLARSLARSLSTTHPPALSPARASPCPLAHLGPRPAPARAQLGSAGARWLLYHQVHLVERAFRALPRVGDETRHPLVAHAEWALPRVLSLIACLHAGE